MLPTCSAYPRRCRRPSRVQARTCSTSCGRHADAHRARGYAPRVKVERVLTQLLHAHPELAVERVQVRGRSGCSDFTGEVAVDRRTAASTASRSPGAAPGRPSRKAGGIASASGTRRGPRASSAGSCFASWEEAVDGPACRTVSRGRAPQLRRTARAARSTLEDPAPSASIGSMRACAGPPPAGEDRPRLQQAPPAARIAVASAQRGRAARASVIDHRAARARSSARSPRTSPAARCPAPSPRPPRRARRSRATRRAAARRRRPTRRRCPPAPPGVGRQRRGASRAARDGRSRRPRRPRRARRGPGSRTRRAPRVCVFVTSSALWMRSPRHTSVPLPRDAALAATRAASSRFAGPSHPRSLAGRIAPVNTTGLSGGERARDDVRASPRAHRCRA